MMVLLLLGCAKSSFPISKGCPDALPDASLRLPFDSADVADALALDVVVDEQEEEPARLELSFRVLPRDEGRVGRVTSRSCPSGRMLQFDADLLWTGSVDGHPFLAREEGLRVQAWDADAAWIVLNPIGHVVLMDPAFTRLFERGHWGDGDPSTARWTVFGPGPGLAKSVTLEEREGRDLLGSMRWQLEPRQTTLGPLQRQPPLPGPHP